MSLAYTDKCGSKIRYLIFMNDKLFVKTEA